MAHDRSSHLADVIDAISKIKDAEKEWHAGFSNPLLRQIMMKTQMELQDELFEIMNQKRGKRTGVGKTAPTQKD